MLGDGTYPSLFDVTSAYPLKTLVNPWVSNTFTGHRNATSQRDELTLLWLYGKQKLSKNSFYVDH